MKERVFITRGCGNCFDKDKFMKIKNAPKINNKPFGGLWACDAEREDWKEWCESEGFYTATYTDETNAFKFKLKKNTRVLVVDSLESCNQIFEKYPYLPMDDMSWMMLNPFAKFINFEKIAEEYDAIEIKNIKEYRYLLAGWDINCLLILNPESIII